MNDSTTPKRAAFRLSLLCLVCLCLAPASPRAAAKTPHARADCFPFERLAPAERVKAEELLLRALDREALYTILGDLKPMSSGFWAVSYPVKEIDLAALSERRRILAHFRCGERLVAHQHHFARVFDGKRSFDAVVFNRAALRRMVGEKQGFWRFYGLTPNSEPLELLLTTEHDQTSRRFVGYGYLFGYPDYAVSFFAEAADQETRTGEFVARDFFVVPVFEAGQRFVWAVPKNHQERAVDRDIKARAARVLADYQARRARYVGAGAAERGGVLELVRAWLCDEQKLCATAARGD
jgi:hypothetical protein